MPAEWSAEDVETLRRIAGRLSFVLVRPAFPGNVGASARALKNMGLRRLAVVPGPTPAGELFGSEARALAHGAEDILDAASVFPTVEQAVAGAGLVAGTTARIRRRVPCLPVDRLPSRLLPGLGENEATILFGPEDRGLTNRELDVCQVLVHIPTSPEHRALNVSQAVLLTAYEVTRDLRRASAPGPGALAPADALEGMFAAMRETLGESGFLNPDAPDHSLVEFRQLLSRAGPTRRETALLRALWKQVLWALRRKPDQRLRWEKARSRAPGREQRSGGEGGEDPR